MGAPEGFERKEILYRIGTFFLLVGVGLLVFFLLSEASGQVSFEYFCGSLVLFIVGFIFRAQAGRAVHSSGRFSLVKKLMPGSKQDQGQKK